LLSCVQFTHILDFVIMMPLGPSLMRVFGLDAQQFSLVVSSYTFSAALSGVAGAFFIDRFDRKKALLTLYTGFILGTLSCAFAPTYTALVAARAAAGAFGGLAGSLVFSIVGDMVPAERRGRAVGRISASFALSSVLGIPVGLALASRFDWHAPFVLLGLLGLLALALGIWGLPSMTRHLQAGSTKVSPLEEVRDVLSDMNHWRAFGLTTMLMFAGFSVIPFLSPYMVGNVGLKESDLPLIYLFGGVATFVSSQAIGWMSDRFGKHRTFTVMALVSIPVILSVTRLGPLSLPLALTATTLFMVTVSGRFVPALALVTSSTTLEHRGSFMSLHSSVQQMASGLAALMAGSIIVTQPGGRLEGYHVVGWGASAATVACLWLARRVQSRDHLAAGGGH
jgi:predicted MFS family arabinose efflux permease